MRYSEPAHRAPAAITRLVAWVAAETLEHERDHYPGPSRATPAVDA